MAEIDLAQLSLTEAATLVERREVSPLELTEACMARAEKLEPQLNAFLTRTFDTALDEAKTATAEIAAGKRRGPLHGIPFALKDLYETVGVRTTAGSPIREHFVPTEDAHVVRRLKEAGAVFLGKLNMHEWALGGTNINAYFPTPHNPWDPSRVTGGSSGGSGAAIAAGLCLGTLGSDTRGSIRIPASLCGVSGIKATYGRVGIRGVVPLNWSLDHAGPLARTPNDCALILNAIAGYDPEDPTTEDRPVPDFTAGIGDGLRGLRVGVPENYFFDGPAVAEEVIAVVRDAIEVFRAEGASMRSIEFPDPARYSDNGAFQADGSAYHEEHLKTQAELFSPTIRTRFQSSLESVRGVDYSRARYRQLELKQAFKRMFEEVDLILTPTTPIVAPRIDEASEATVAGSLIRNTGIFNTAGTPVMSVPCGFSLSGLPIGLQIAGRAWEEALVLRAGQAYQKATEWHTRAPAL